MAKNIGEFTLESTEQNIREAEKILALLDEIEALRQKDPKNVDMAAVQRATGGLTRSQIQTTLLDLRMKRASFLREKENAVAYDSARENNALSAEVSSLKAEVTRLQGMLQAQTQGVQVPSSRQSMPASTIPATVNAIDGFKSGDNAIILEGVYTGLSDELEKVRESLRQELQYAYQQELAIYNDLSAQIATLGAMDPAVLAEKITEVSQLKATDIKVLEDKLSRIEKVDCDALAEKVAQKMGATVALPVSAETEEVTAIKAELAEMKEMLAAVIYGKNKDDSEFHLLDYEISEYLATENLTALQDLMTEARDLLAKAQKYVDNGNDMRAEEVVEGVKSRLATVTVCGSEQLVAAANFAQNNAIPMAVSVEKLFALADVFANYEKQSILPEDELTQEIVLAKKEAIGSADLTVFDKQTLIEMSEVGEFSSVADIDEQSALKLRTLKQEMLTIPLDVLVCYQTEKVTEARGKEELNATKELLAEIRALKSQIEAGVSTHQTEVAPQEETSIDELSVLTEELNDIVRGASVEVEAEKVSASTETLRAPSKPKTASKKVFRPAVSGRDSKVQNSGQPLAVRRTKVKISKDEATDSLANELVSKVAENMAKTRIK